MISKDLKKLSRRELMDIIYQMKKNEQQMQEEIASLQEALQERSGFGLLRPAPLRKRRHPLPKIV